MIHLRVFKEHQMIKDLTFVEDVVSLGRAPSNHVVLPDESVSWLHAVIEKENETWILKDLGSLNGLRLDHHLPVTEIKIENVVHCLLGVFELEIELIPSGKTRLLKKNEWMELNRRRGLSHYVGYILSSVLLLVGAFLLIPLTWNLGDSFFIGGILVSAIAVPLVALFFLIIYQALHRKIRLADTLELLRDFSFLLFSSVLVQSIAYYFLSIEIHQWLSTVINLSFISWMIGKLFTYKISQTQWWPKVVWTFIISFVSFHSFWGLMDLYQHSSKSKLHLITLPPYIKPTSLVTTDTWINEFERQFQLLELESDLEESTEE